MNTRFKVFASYNILQYLCDFIHVLIFVTVSKCRKIPKLTNIVMKPSSRGFLLCTSTAITITSLQLSHTAMIIKYFLLVMVEVVLVALMMN
jgi:hypothetical protein